MLPRASAEPVSVPRPRIFLRGLVVLAGFMAFVAWDQSHWWALKEDYIFGWLVPVFVGYVVLDRWPRIKARWTQPWHGAARPAPAWAWLAGLGPVLFGLALLGGAVLFLLGALHRAATGSSYNGTLVLTLGMATTALAAIYFLAPTGAPTARERHEDRRLMAGIFAFPALVWLVSAPMLAIVENSLNVFLMRQVTTIVFSVFDGLGLVLEQRGNVLILPTGNVGVAEACSGIRSLTGCLFSGLFLAAVYVRTVPGKILLVAASLLLAFAANALRSLFLTTWAYNYGAKSIEGTIHDVSGYAVLGITVLGLLCCLPLLDSRKARAVRAAPA
jgi:exosortase/archaeosortase family protein